MCASSGGGFPPVLPGRPPSRGAGVQVTLCNILTIEEHITYAPLPGDATKTLMTQEAKITVGGSLFGTSMLERQLVSNIEKNAAKVSLATCVAVCLWRLPLLPFADEKRCRPSLIYPC